MNLLSPAQITVLSLAPLFLPLTFQFLCSSIHFSHTVRNVQTLASVGRSVGLCITAPPRACLCATRCLSPHRANKCVSQAVTSASHVDTTTLG